jgi:fructose-bisphosphate aldolase class II
MLMVAEIMRRAWKAGLVVPAFNIPYLPMLEAVVRAVIDQECFSLIEVARLEWTKFESISPARVAAEFSKWHNPDHVRLHLDHIPVIDEDGQRVDFLPIMREALALGYESVMIDGSRLPFEENIQATRQVVELAHAMNAPVEAELGAVLGHESGLMPSYEELYASGRGFTGVDEAGVFVLRSGCDWLSVAVGNIHGAIASGRKDQKKIEARLNLEHLERLSAATHVPLVLHGGSGIQPASITGAVQRGIVKINVGTEIRQPYETALRETGSLARAQQAVYDRAAWVLRDLLGISGTGALLMKENQ